MESDIEVVTCKICKDTGEYGNAAMTQCDNCQEWACWDCDEEVRETQLCNQSHCRHCRNGMCFNNRTLKTYCSSCAPELLVKQNEDEMKNISEMINTWNYIESTKDVRKELLQKELHKKGLELRQDSKLCKAYIERDEGDIDSIVETMCEMKWLFEYCNMRKMLKKVEEEWVETIEAGFIPDFNVWDEARRRISENMEYPSVWPWLKK